MSLPYLPSSASEDWLQASCQARAGELLSVAPSTSAGRRGARQDQEPPASRYSYGDPGLSSLKSCSKTLQSLRSTGHSQAAR